MSYAYINLYNKSSLTEIAKTLISKKYTIYSQGSTYEFLIKNNIEANEVKFETHPNIEVINSILGKSKKLPKFKLIIADIEEPIDIYNTLLVIAALKKNIPVVTDNASILKLNNHLTFFDEINERLKKELIYDALNNISYNFSLSTFQLYPYINTCAEKITIPLKKFQKIKYGENPNQKCYIYLSPIKSNINLKNIKTDGELNLNHYIDINKVIKLFKDIKDPALIVLKHGNISFISFDSTMEKVFEKFLNEEHQSGMVYALNRDVNIDIVKNLKKYIPEAIIGTSFSNQAISYILKNMPETKIITFEPNLITIPDEKIIFPFLNAFAVEDENILSQSQMKILTVKPDDDIVGDINLATILLKNIKTYASFIISNKTLLSYSQGEDSSYTAVKVAIFKLNTKNMIKLKIDRIVAGINGSLTENSFNELLKLPVKVILQFSREIDEKIKKIALEKRISIIATDNRYFNHF